MARIRTIKPDFFKNEELADLPAMIRLLFIGLWTLADREGRLEDRPKRIKAELFPYDNLDVEKALNELQSSGFIVRYKGNANISDRILSPEQPAKEVNCIQVVNFSKHQKIDKANEKESQLPVFQGNNSIDYEKTIDSLPIEGERKGKEGKGKERKEAATPEPDLIFPFESEEFKNMWLNWKKYKREQHKFAFKSTTTEQAAVNELVKVSRGEEQTAVAIILQSIAQGWKGFFELKNSIQNGNGNTRQATGAPADRLANNAAKLAAALAGNTGEG